MNKKSTSLFLLSCLMVLTGLGAYNNLVYATDKNEEDVVSKSEDVKVENSVETTTDGSKEAIKEDVKKETITPVDEEKQVPQENKTVVAKDSVVRSIGQVFLSNTSNGTPVYYQVLSEDVNSKTGTVEVGNGGNVGPNGSSLGSNGLTNKYAIDGVLELPDTVTNNGYTYKVVKIGWFALSGAGIKKIKLPKYLNEITANSLNSNQFESLSIPEGVTRIGDMALHSNKQLKVVKFPKTITSLGAALFQGNDMLTTVYFPADNVTYQVDDNSRTNLPFYGLDINKSVVIVDTREAYNKWRNDTTIIHQSLSHFMVTYEMDAEFYDKNLTKLRLPSVKKLYGRSVAYTKNTTTDEYNYVNYKKCNDLPALPNESTLGYTAKYWAINDIGISTVDASGNIKESAEIGGGAYGDYFNVIDGKFVAVEDEFQPIVEGINKTFDNKAEGVNFTSNRKIGANYFLSSTRYITTYFNAEATVAFPGYRFTGFPGKIGPMDSIEAIEAGFKNVADSGIYKYNMIFYDKETVASSRQAIAWMTHPAGGYTTVSVDIKPAVISIHPFVTNNEIFADNLTTLPELKLLSDDTKGKISWDAGQTLKEGKHSYTYTFTPDNLYADGIKGNHIANYTEVEKTGYIEITYTKVSNYTVEFKGKDGRILKSEVVKENTSATAPVPPVIEGYNFIGWDKKFDNVTENITVTAQYRIKTYFVVYLDDNANVLKSGFVEHGKGITAPNVPLKEGYTFKKWSIDTSSVTEHMIVIPIYEINKYTVKYVDYNGKVIKEDIVEYGKKTTAPTIPDRKGYVFSGWDKEFNIVKSDMVVTAQYKKQPVITPKPTPNPTPKPTPTTPTTDGSNQSTGSTTQDPTTSNNPTTDNGNQSILDEKVDFVENKQIGTKIETINKDKVFSPNSKIIVEDSNKEEIKKAEEKLDNVIKVFDVILEEDGVKVEKTLDSKIRIYIDAKDFDMYKDMRIYHKETDGRYTELTMKVENGQIIFECDALDSYVLTGIKDEFPWWIVIVASVLASGIIIILVKRRKKDEKAS